MGGFLTPGSEWHVWRGRGVRAVRQHPRRRRLYPSTTSQWATAARCPPSPFLPRRPSGAAAVRRCGAQMRKTRLIRRSLRPKWNETLAFPIAAAQDGVVRFSVKALTDDLDTDAVLGEAAYDAGRLSWGRSADETLALRPADGGPSSFFVRKDRGSLRVNFEVVDGDAAAGAPSGGASPGGAREDAAAEAPRGNAEGAAPVARARAPAEADAGVAPLAALNGTATACAVGEAAADGSGVCVRHPALVWPGSPCALPGPRGVRLRGCRRACQEGGGGGRTDPAHYRACACEQVLGPAPPHSCNTKRAGASPRKQKLLPKFTIGDRTNTQRSTQQVQGGGGDNFGRGYFCRKSPRREVVRSSAGASVVYPPFLGSFA